MGGRASLIPRVWCKMSVESLQALNLAVQTLSQIEFLSIDGDVKDKLIEKVLEAVGIEKPKQKKRVTGSQEKILESLKRLGGTATRAAIASDSGLDPNSVSSQLTRLVRNGKVTRSSFDELPSTNGRGLDPEYVYTLVDEGSNGDAG